MRRSSGARKTVLAVWIAVLAAVAALVAAAVPVAAAAAPVAAQANPAPAVGLLTPSGLFKALAEGAAKQTGGQFAGWALGAIGLGGSDTADLSKISGQLQAINSQLSGIQATLDGIKNEIEAQTCNQQLHQASDAVVTIRTLETDYKVLVALGAQSVVDIPRMAKFADEVLNGTRLPMTVKTALTTIHTAMDGPAGTGILKSCLKDSIVPPPGAGDNNYFGTDVGYYGYYEFGSEQSSGRPTVNSFMGYYYGYEALGLMMLQEADRFEAQQAVGETNLTPETVGDLCDLQKHPAAAGDCVDAEIWTNDVYGNLAKQFKDAGLPYTDDKVVLRNAGDHPLFVRSLEDFTRVLAPGCHDPLTSANPCGVTVASWDTAADAMHVPYDGYGTWHTMTSGQVTDVIGTRGHLTPGQYMDKLGFENAEHKIVLTSTKTQFKTPSSPPRVKPPNPGYPSIHGTMVCLFHTDVTGGQFCGSDDVSNRLLELTGGCSGYARGWKTNGALPTNNNDFFAADACGTSWRAQPGWLVGNTGHNARQYRWPLLTTGNLACTAGRSHTNAGDVPTRCGADFDALFNTMVTRPSTCPGTRAGECGGQVVRSAARLRITRVRATPLRRGCVTEMRRDEREITARVADATCRHFRLTVAGTI